MGVKKKTDLGDMVWVKYGRTEYCAFLVTSNTPEHIVDEETGALKVQVEWNGWSNAREWVFVHDILHKSSIDSIGLGGGGAGGTGAGGGDIGRGQRAKRTPQEATAQKEEETAAWLAERSRQQQSSSNKKPRPSISKSCDQATLTSSAQEEDDEDEGEEQADNFVDLCSSSSTGSVAMSESSEEEDDDDEEDEETGYRTGRRKSPVVPIQPYGLYDPRFEYIDESSESEDDDDNVDADGVNAENDNDNDSLGSGSDSEGEDEAEEDAVKRIIVRKTTEVVGNSPPGVKLQTIVDMVHAELGDFNRPVDSYATIAQQMDFLMKQQRRRAQGRGR